MDDVNPMVVMPYDLATTQTRGGENKESQTINSRLIRRENKTISKQEF